MSVSVCLCLCIVVTGCNGSRISLHASRHTRIVGWDDAGISKKVEEGRGMEKLVIVAISLNFLTESLLDE